MRTHHRIERTAPIFSYEHVAVATTRDVCPLFTVTSTVASKGSRASATSTTLERSVNGSPGLTLSSTRTSSARMVINGGRGKIARSINAIDAAQFPCALATAPNIAGATTPEQVAANAAACSWDLGDDERAVIEALRPG